MGFQLIRKGRYKSALMQLEKGLINKMDERVGQNSPDSNDWITDCEAQKQTYWAANEVSVLLATIK